MWGTADNSGDNIVWGTRVDNIVWGTLNAVDNIVWGTAGDGDNIVWGTADDGDNIVWGTDCGGDDCDNIVWGTADCRQHRVGHRRRRDNIVWGTSGRRQHRVGHHRRRQHVLGHCERRRVVFSDDATARLTDVAVEFGDISVTAVTVTGWEHQNMEKMPYREELDDCEYGVPAIDDSVVSTRLAERASGACRTDGHAARTAGVDAASLFALLTTEEVARFISPPPTSVEGFEKFIAWAHRERQRPDLAASPSR